MQPGVTSIAAVRASAAPASVRGNGKNWLAISVLIALPAALPLAIILGSLLLPEWQIWQHLVRYVLPDVLRNTAGLVLGVAIGTFLLGTSLAWLTSVYEFPGRRLLSWALLLPLAIPGYVLGFVAIGFFEYAGPLQTLLRSWLGDGFALPAIRSYGGILAVMSFALYPYVYLIARAAFLTQGQRALEVAQGFGLSRAQGFFRVALPMARPWLAGAVMLVVMETLADFGTVSVFNYDTFTTAIYEAWFSLFSLHAALQLALLLLVFVVVAVAVEHKLRAGAQYTAAGSASRRRRFPLAGLAAVVVSSAAWLVVLIGFGLPLVQLVVWSVANIDELDMRYIGYAGRTLFLAGTGALMITFAAVLLSYAIRKNRGRLTAIAARFATLGYALPGTVLAVGIFVPLAAMNNVLQDILNAVLDTSAPRIMIQLSLLTMYLAYIARFLAVAFNPVDSNMHRITRSIDEAALGFGVTGMAVLRSVHLPILRAGLWTALALTFVDLMKELPITLMTRPFGWETLAVRVFEMTSEGEWERAALPAVAIVITGLIPVAVMARRVERAS